MSSLNRPARLNRWVLALCGIVLLIAGGLALSAHFGLLPWLPATSPLVAGTALPPTWVLILTAATAVLLGLLCLRWLAAQLIRRPKTTTWRLDTEPEHGRTTLSADVAVAPLVSDITAYHGVHAVSAVLAGQQDNPTLVLTIRANHGTDLNAVRRQINQHGIPRLRQALDLPSLPVWTEFRYTSKTAPRAL
ncbi:hypothetical protein [Kibdelosporangium aridum]|uniref:Alkaline shock response membrane anchor protein AmaP n=1 Tax=Kibdelosporangium aridum TaxID=2030 RepID=A0A1W2FVE0_KIBAR|nr:hypothetical protein [Kibdelosporangium aridum]SMD25937.1 hypothetical protein SAMN05661093_09515 [Kibdelosporangium aridum]